MDGFPAAPSPVSRLATSGGSQDHAALAPALLPGLSNETRALILSIIARENQARKLLIPGTGPLTPTPPQITTTVRFTEAGLALLAAKTRTGPLRRAAKNRYKALVADSIQNLLGWRSLRQVAREAGMDAMNVSLALRGKKEVHVHTAVRLAAALHVPIEVLIAHLEKVRTQPLAAVAPHSSQRKRPSA